MAVSIMSAVSCGMSVYIPWPLEAFLRHSRKNVVIEGNPWGHGAPGPVGAKTPPILHLASANTSIRPEGRNESFGNGAPDHLGYGAFKGQQIRRFVSPLREKERMRVGIPAGRMFSKCFHICPGYR